MADGMHSTGRGGQGNIGRDTTTVYTDGGIVREGIQGPHQGESEYSTGRGGLGNIDPTAPPSSVATAAGASKGVVNEDDYVPEPSLRPHTDEYDNFHTGRGGQGNIHKEKYGGHSSAQEQHRAEHHHRHDSETKNGGSESKSTAVLGKVKELLHLDSHNDK